MFKNTTPNYREFNKCSRRDKNGLCKGACTVATTPKTPKCNCAAYKRGCPCQPVELCKKQCAECLPGRCSKCLLQPGCPSSVTPECRTQCKCQFVQVCSCDNRPSKVCKKRCAPEGKYPACYVPVPPPQQLPKKRGCKPSIDLFISRIGMGDVILESPPMPTGAYQLKPLTLRQISNCVKAPKVNPCPKKLCKCKCGK